MFLYNPANMLNDLLAYSDQFKGSPLILVNDVIDYKPSKFIVDSSSITLIPKEHLNQFTLIIPNMVSVSKETDDYLLDSGIELVVALPYINSNFTIIPIEGLYEVPGDLEIDRHRHMTVGDELTEEDIQFFNDNGLVLIVEGNDNCSDVLSIINYIEAAVPSLKQVKLYAFEPAYTILVGSIHNKPSVA